MAISSKSTKIFKAEDPVQETDLDLFARVGQFKEAQFDAGEKQLQDTINNWSMLRSVAKPQDKEYINGKLNALVSGINNLGGVDLSDANNVNQLKSLGYNLYGDENVMNPVITTRKMNALAQDIYTKLNGKDAKNYDSVLGEYQMNQYNSWLNDDKQGTSFDGPTSLQTGNFDQYNKKLIDGISKMKPDENSVPMDSKDAAFNYYQVGDKFIKKERIQAFIDANTSEQDKVVLNAHAWKSMSHIPDADLIHAQSKSYDADLVDLKSQSDKLKAEYGVTNDVPQRLLFEKQIKQIDDAIADVNDKKTKLPKDKFENNIQREDLQQNLFFKAYKQDLANGFAYDQQKTELKTNVGKIAEYKQAIDAFQFKERMKRQDKSLELKEKDTKIKQQLANIKTFGLYANGQGAKFGLQGPAMNAPLSLVANDGDKDATKLSNDITQQADANVVAKGADFTSVGYDYLMGKDSELWGKYLHMNEDGKWVPINADAEKIVSKGIRSALDLYGNIANMPISERNNLKLTDEDINFLKSSKDFETAVIYKNQIKDLTEQVFTKAVGSSPYSKTVTIKMKGLPDKTLTYAELKELSDRKDPILDVWKKSGDVTYSNKLINTLVGVARPNTVTEALKTVDDYYNDSAVKKEWENRSKTFNVYAASAGLPKDKKGHALESFAKPIADLIRSGTDDTAKKNLLLEDIDLSRVYPVYDATAKGDNKVRYMADVIYRKGEKGKEVADHDKSDKITKVDLTSIVLQQQAEGGGWFSNLYPQDDAEVAYGMILNGNGKTPLDASNNYYGALQTHSNALLTHKYQITAHKNDAKGIDYYDVKVLIPFGKDKSGKPIFKSVPVTNTDPNYLDPNSTTTTTRFPANIKVIRDFMDQQFETSDNAKTFYKINGIPYNQQ